MVSNIKTLQDFLKLIHRHSQDREIDYVHLRQDVVNDIINSMKNNLKKDSLVLLENSIAGYPIVIGDRRSPEYAIIYKTEDKKC